MNFSLRVYRALIKLFPAGFREEYSTVLEQQFANEYRTVRRPFEHCRFWLRALHDLAVSIPRELSQEVAQDLSYAARISVRRPLLTVLMLLPLSFGIGASTGVFSVVNALLVRSLPFRAPRELVELWMFPRGLDQTPSSMREWIHRSVYLRDAALYDSIDMNVSRISAALRVAVTETSANFFELLGMEPALGRTFLPNEDTPGKNAVAVISYGLWQELFAGDPRALGSTIRVNGIPLQIIGVANPRFDYPGHTAIWTATGLDINRIPKTQIVVMNTIGRLKPGLSLNRAEAMYEADIEHIAPAYLHRDKINRPRLIALNQQLAGPAGKASLILLAMVAFVLFIGCANVANLLLTRTVGRQKELAIRAALGASNARVVQQLVIESSLVSLIAGVSGLVIAHAAAGLFSKFQPAPSGFQQYSVLDWRVLTFALALALITGLLFGVLPALVTARRHASGELTSRETLSHSSPANRTRSILIAIQVALTLVLLSGAIALGHAFLKLTEADLGFNRHNVVTMSVSLAEGRFDSDPNYQSNLRRFYRQALERLRAVEGVESAAIVDYLPLLSDMFEGARFHSPSGQKVPLSLVSAVSPGYFKTMGIRILYGRDFSAGDSQPSSRAVIVNRNFARLLGATSDLIGKQILQDTSKDADTIVGVVENVRNSPESAAVAEIFYDAERSPRNFMTFVARVAGPPESYLAVCRDIIQQVDPEIPVFGAKTLDQRFNDAVAQPQLYTIVVSFLGAFALLLALSGIYGVVSYSIARRTQELGIRLAIGASTARVRLEVLVRSLLPVCLGLIVGLAGTAASQKLIEHLIATSSPSDTATWTSSLLLLTVTAAAAVWIATQRILRLDPIDVLRSE